MSYEEGISFDTITVSDFEKYKIILTFVLIIRQMCLIDNFIHADLHIGNWKIKQTDDKYNKIVIYDCGLYINPDNKSLVTDWFDAWESNDLNNIGKILLSQIKFNKNNTSKDIIHTLLMAFLNKNYEHNGRLNINDLIRNLTLFLKNNKLLLNGNLINLIIIMSLIEKNLTKYNFTGELDINKSNDKSNDKTNDKTNNCYRNQYLDFIAFCNTTKEFTNLKNYTELKLKESNIKYNNLFDNIEDKLKISNINIDTNLSIDTNEEIILSL